MNNLFTVEPAQVSAAIVLVNIALSLVLQLGISWVYRRTHRGLSYSPSFIFTLIIVGLLGTFLMMTVRQNFIGSVALLGAFSLIRFRTILKETRDVAFLFFALAAGVAIGTGSYATGFVSTVMISLIVLGLDRYRVGSTTNDVGFILTFSTRGPINMEAVKATLAKYAGVFTLLQTRTHGTDTTTHVFSLKLKESLDAVAVSNSLKENPSIVDVELITGERSVEY